MFDFSEYKEKGGLENIGSFYQSAGLLTGGKRRTPSDPVSGYLEILTEMNADFESRMIIDTTPPHVVINPCNGCGGGQVR